MNGAARTTGNALTLSQRRLLRELQRLRVTSGLSQADVAHEMEWSASKQEKIETGAVGVRVPDLRAMLDLFEVAPDEREAMLQLCRDARRHRWWHDYSDVIPAHVGAYLGFEDEAQTLRTFTMGSIPSLLQTGDYAHAVMEVRHPALSRHEMDRMVSVLLTRQKLLTKPDPLRLWAVLDESALHRQVGGGAVMTTQLAHVATMAALPNVVVQVIPYGAGAHACMDGGFSLLDFPYSGDTPTVFEGVHHARLQQPDGVSYFREVFARLTSCALPETPSAELIGHRNGARS